MRKRRDARQCRSESQSGTWDFSGATKAAMTSVVSERKEVWAQILQTRLRGAHPGASQSCPVCFAQALVHRPRSTSAGYGARLQVCGAQVWRYGVAVCVQDYRRHTRGRADALQPRSCRVTTRICVRGWSNHGLSKQESALIAVCKSGC